MLCGAVFRSVELCGAVQQLVLPSKGKRASLVSNIPEIPFFSALDGRVVLCGSLTVSCAIHHSLTVSGVTGHGLTVSCAIRTVQRPGRLCCGLTVSSVVRPSTAVSGAVSNS